MCVLTERGGDQKATKLRIRDVIRGTDGGVRRNRPRISTAAHPRHSTSGTVNRTQVVMISAVSTVPVISEGSGSRPGNPTSSQLRKVGGGKDYEILPGVAPRDQPTPSRDGQDHRGRSGTDECAVPDGVSPPSLSNGASMFDDATHDDCQAGVDRDVVLEPGGDSDRRTPGKRGARIGYGAPARQVPARP